MKKITLFIFSIISSFTFSQAPNIEWQKCLGSAFTDSILVDTVILYYPGHEVAKSIVKTLDGGLIFAGTTSGNNGDVSGYHLSTSYYTGYNQEYTDAWVVKLDASGNILWQKCLGGSNDDMANDIIQTSDGGYIIAGNSSSNNGDVAGNHGNSDFWIVKLDNNGNIQWQKCYGGTGIDIAYSIKEASQGGYIIAGEIKNYSSSNGDIIGYNGGDSDAWVIKISSTGGLEWQKCFGSTSTDLAKEISITNDGGFILTGSTNSYYGQGNHGASMGVGSTKDFWVVKADNNGNTQWQKLYGGSNDDMANCIIKTSDNGYIIVGTSNSNNGDLFGNIDGRIWVVKIDVSGNISWQKRMHGDNAYSIIETLNGEFVISGESNYYSYLGGILNHGQLDLWVIKFSNNGNIIWENSLGGTLNDLSYDIVQTADGGFVVAGTTASDNYNGDVYGNHGISVRDAWVVKLSPYNFLEETNSTQINLSPNPTSGLFSINTSIENLGYAFNILDNTGKSVYNGNVEALETVIDIQNLLPGLYFFNLENNSESIKIIKQ
jgi:hypothetical protein